MNKIRVSAPGKLMLLGEHAVVYNHPCLVTAVDQRMHVIVEALESSEFQLEAKDVGVVGYKKPIAEIGKGDIPKVAKFVEMGVAEILRHVPSGAWLRNASNDKMGIKITTKSEFLSKFGFGSSSAVTVCVVQALSELFKLSLSKKEIFDLSYKTVLDIQGKGSGFDVASAVYGGTLYFVTGGKVIESLNIKNLTLIVGYSGVKADTVKLITKVKEAFSNRQNRLEEIYNGIAKLVDLAKDALIKKDLKTLGRLMYKNQDYLEQLGVSTQKLDAMISKAIKAGAYGAKLSGAGGGDCMIAVSHPNRKQEVNDAIISAGGKILSINTNEEGVRVEN